MEKTLLTKVVTQLVNERANAQEYGVALVNIPDFDYVAFALGLSSERKAALFFLGFPESTRARIESELSQNERLSYDFTVEKAEESRNSGDESIFRVLVIKRAEMEKMSSLRWFPEITLERIYTKSCDLAKKDLAGTNAVIEALIQALRSKPIRSILSFERVLEYLELLISSPADTLPDAIKENYYRLVLIAGTTGSGKTIFLYSIIVSLLHKYPMEDLEFLIIDPKQTDFVFFEDLPNLYGGHVVVDAEEALEMIQRINDVDKEGRMQQLRFCRSRDIGSYNEKNPDHRMKRLIIIIDEYADLIQTAEMQGKRKEFEKFLSMLAQKVRSLGIHLIIATQRPSANIVTGVLKANIPYRISFRLPSHTDSQTILDMPGAENLLGKGDMLMVTDSDTIRMQGLYISEDELDNFVKSRQ